MNFTIVLLIALGSLMLLASLELVEANPSKKTSENKNGWFSKDKGHNKMDSGGFQKKKKGGTMRTLKKAAVIGAVAYGGYQLGKLSSKFSGFGSGGFGGMGGMGGGGWGFNDWNRWREVDGFMCRDSNDCIWIDRNLFCQDYELDFQPSALWFGGDIARIVGECSCPSGMVWDDREMQCQAPMYGGGAVGAISMAVVATIVIVVLLMLCCCVAAAVFVIKKFL